MVSFKGSQDNQNNTCGVKVKVQNYKYSHIEQTFWENYLNLLIEYTLRNLNCIFYYIESHLLTQSKVSVEIKNTNFLLSYPRFVSFITTSSIMEDSSDWKVLRMCSDKMDLIITSSVTYSKNDQ